MKPYNTLLPVLALSCLAPPLYATETEQDLAAQVAKLSEQVAELQKQADSPAISFSGRVQLDYNWFNGAYNANENGSSGSAAEIIMARVRYSGFDNGLRWALGLYKNDAFGSNREEDSGSGFAARVLYLF
jgi:phosphate-selective porin OprO/OprP